MIPAWAEAYVGIPYRFGGSSRDGADCWGLARLALRERFGVDLPEVPHAEGGPAHLGAVAAAALPMIATARVEAPLAGDLVLLRVFGHPCHVGLVVDEEGGYMLHTLGQHDSALERYTSARWAPRLEGFYRVR